MFKFKSFVKRLKKEKYNKKLRIEDISAASGIPIGTVSKIFASITTDPKISTVVSIAESLGVSIDYLVYGICKSNLSKEEIDMLNKYHQLNVDDKEEIDAILDFKIKKMNRKISKKEALD